MWEFFSLNAQAPAKITHWEVRDLPSARFTVSAEYHYEVGGKALTGSTLFQNRYFLNRFAAENHGKLIEAKRWRVWYREGNPSVSSLEREFPQKDLLQALLTVGVFAYFYFARGLLNKLSLG